MVSELKEPGIFLTGICYTRVKDDGTGERSVLVPWYYKTLWLYHAVWFVFCNIE